MVKTVKRFHGDQNGAVMLIGLFMSTFLIGTTWFVFGIAKTLVFRQRVQEAADAAAFSDAAIQAKGMNLIAAVNLIMFAITAVWMLLRTFEHIMYLLQTTVVWNGDNCHGFGCSLKSCDVSPLAFVVDPAISCGFAEGLQSVRDVNSKARKKVGDFMWTLFPKLSKVQDVTARVAPVAGTVASLALGAKYHHFTIALSPSLLPGEDLKKLAEKIEEKHEDKAAKTEKEKKKLDEERKKKAEKNEDPTVEAPLGLPVVSKKFGWMCGRAVGTSLEAIKNAVKNIPIAGKVVDLPIIKQVIDGVISGVKSYAQDEFCSDGDWPGNDSKGKLFKLRGPKVIFEHAENGNDLLQVWAFTYGVSTDGSAPKVAMAGRIKGIVPQETSHWYIAQAEYYFDCGGEWSSATCNGNDNAAFSMRWRARLRRVRTPDFFAEGGRYLRDAILNGPVKDALRDAFGLTEKEPTPGSEGEKKNLGSSILDGLFDQGFDLFKNTVNNATGLGNDTTGENPAEILH